MTNGTTTGGLLGRVLRAAGVGAVFGDELPGVPVVATPSAASAALLAGLHARIHGGLAASAHDGLLIVTDGSALSAPSPSPVRVDSPEAVAAVAPALAHAQTAGMAVVVQLDLDLTAPVDTDVAVTPPDVVDRWVEPDADAIGALGAARSPIVLAGPGVIRAGAVPGLHAFATAGRLGVLNTWGAKGVFDWRSRHHLATAGLQAEDFTLGGLADADLIVAVGVDEGEAPADRWQTLAPVLGISPGEMDPLSQVWSRSAEWPDVPELRTRLAGVTQAGWADERLPLMPTRVTRAYGAALGDGGLVAADAGVAGYWVARTFATTRLGGAQVPAEVVPGFAVAAALVARLRAPSRPVLAVLDAAPEGAALEVLDLADRLGLGIGVEVWSADGDRLDADAHLARLRRLATVDRSEVVTLATSPDQLPQMVEAAGPIVAWPSLGLA